jgi:hypothetical protein
LSDKNRRTLAGLQEKCVRTKGYPGCSCYANTIADTVLSKEYKTRLLNVADSIDVIQQHSPYQVGELPVFFQKMGMNPPSSVPK